MNGVIGAGRGQASAAVVPRHSAHAAWMHESLRHGAGLHFPDFNLWPLEAGYRQSVPFGTEVQAIRGIVERNPFFDFCRRQIVSVNGVVILAANRQPTPIATEINGAVVNALGHREALTSRGQVPNDEPVEMISIRQMVLRSQEPSSGTKA